MSLKDYLKEHKKQHIIFDLDETIFELILPWNDWEKDIEQELKNIDPQILNNYKKGEIDLNALQNAYVSKYPQTLDFLIQHNINFETKNLNGALSNPGLINFIKNSNNLDFYIWTSNTRAVAEKVLGENQILNKFKKIVTRDDVAFLKPNIEGFFKIYKNDQTKTNYLFVGDSQSDKIAAKDAEIDFFLVDYFA